MHNPRANQLGILPQNPMAQKVSEDRLSGRMQRPARYPVCRNPTRYICRGSNSLYWSHRIDTRARRQTAFRGSTPDYSSRLSAEVFFTRGYFRKTVVAYPLLGELPKAIEPHLLICQLYRWQLGSNKRSLPTTKSSRTIVVTALLVDFSEESIRLTTVRFACNCPVPEEWTTEASSLGRSRRLINIQHTLKNAILESITMGNKMPGRLVTAK